MARSGQELSHPVTGERIVWHQVAVDTGGTLLRGELFAAPRAFVAAEHIHPSQEERFEVRAGTLGLRLDGVERVLRAGDAAVIAPGRPHVWWNAGDDEVRLIGEFRPALRTEMFFETFFGLAQDGRTNSKGLPTLLQLAVLIREYPEEIRLARPSAGMQKALFGPLALAGRLLGYRGWYPRYTSEPVPRASATSRDVR
jgi:quercetin dioxygenase-like cupin family protein